LAGPGDDRARGPTGPTSMRIATITNWAYGATVLLTIVSGATMLMASHAEEGERAAVQQRARFDHLTEALVEDTYRLTEQARLFTISGDPSHLIVYQDEAANLDSAEVSLRKLQDMGAQPAELKALEDGLRWADTLREEQAAAIAAKQKGQEEVARQIIFGPEYERELERVSNLIGRFRYMLDERTQDAVEQAERASRQFRLTSEIMLAITALLFLFVLYFIIMRRVLRPVGRLSDVVTRLAAQDFAVEPPEYSRIDEIGDMTQAIRIFRENALARQRLEAQRDADLAMRELLARMTQRLQGCDAIDDVMNVVRLFAPEIAPGFAGRLYVHDARTETMTSACEWRSPQGSASKFRFNDCWALRRGQVHRPGGTMIDVPCGHLHGEQAGASICIPLIGQGETIGLIYFEPCAESAGPLSESDEVYLVLLAERVGLALANLRLHEALREMALVDPLTGLSNRRQLEATLKLHVENADQSGRPVSCLMLDVDHFKTFNDDFGHDAGDAVLKAVGGVLKHSVRGEGNAFRYGGEEFLLLMPGMGMEQARERAEGIRRAISALQLDHKGAPLGRITASFGLATYPAHGSGDNLVSVADAALLRAKAEGRDRIVVAAVREADMATVR
jgi:diguanylate cyclase (GGDEF)-like protein